MKTNRWRLWARLLRLALLLGWLVVVVDAAAQSTGPAARNFDQVAISPDGSRVAWVQSSVDGSGEPTGGSAIYVQELRSQNAKPRRMSAGTGDQAESEGTIAWSPDSRHL